jgi:hypothetical protein
MSDFGPQLLGRNASTPDFRDYPLSAFLDSTDPLDTTLAALLKSTSVAKATKNWAVVATARLKELTPTPPPPPSPTGAVSWSNVEPVLDQGQTPHCVGFSGAQWGNTLPINDKFDNEDGHKFYYTCKTYDGQPNQENGSSLRSLAKTLKAASRLTTYAFAATVDETLQWILTKGPVVFGTDWYTGMFNPDSKGIVRPTGFVEGGHAYLAIGYDPTTSMIEFLNSWSAQWGINGRFYMHKNDAVMIFSNRGEGLVAVELPL